MLQIVAMPVEKQPVRLAEQLGMGPTHLLDVHTHLHARGAGIFSSQAHATV